MDPIPTLDALLVNPAADPDRLRRAAERAITAAIADWQAIRAIDAAVVQADGRVFDRPVQAAVRGQYEAWVAAAQLLEARVAAVAKLAGPVAGAGDLFDTVGKTMAQLSVSLDAAEEAARAHADGRVTRYASVEEIRRELRLRAGVR